MLLKKTISRYIGIRRTLECMAANWWECAIRSDFRWLSAQYTCTGVMFMSVSLELYVLTHWSPMAHVSVSGLENIVHGLSPFRHQAITWTNADKTHTGKHFCEILTKTSTISLINTFENVVWKMAAILFKPRCVDCGYESQRLVLWMVTMGVFNPVALVESTIGWDTVGIGSQGWHIIIAN